MPRRWHTRGPQGSLAPVIPHGHPIATPSAQREPLQERRALTRGTPASLTADRVRILPQPALILCKFLPREVARVRLRDQRGPLLARHPLDHHPRLASTALPTAAEKEGARKAWIMKYPERAPMLQRDPPNASVVDAMTGVTGT
jgi:hypothetical protein